MCILGYYSFAFFQASVASEPAEGLGRVGRIVIPSMLAPSGVLGDTLRITLVLRAVTFLRTIYLQLVSAPPIDERGRRIGPRT